MKKIFIVAGVVVLLAVAGRAFWAYQKVKINEKQVSIQENTRSTSATPSQLAIPSNWQNHLNNTIGFSFKYPQGWLVQDEITGQLFKGGLGSTGIVDVFSSGTPYNINDRLKQDVMKAQFQYHVDASISSKQQYIDSQIEELSNPDEMGLSIIIDKSAFSSVQNENGLDILKFNGVMGDVDYVISINPNFSEVFYVIVWNPEIIFEKVLATFKLVK